MTLFRDRTFLIWGCPFHPGGGGGGVWGGVESRRSLCRKLFTSGGSFNREIRCITRFIFLGGREVRSIGMFFISGNSLYRKVHTIRYSRKFVVWRNKLHQEVR